MKNLAGEDFILEVTSLSTGLLQAPDNPVSTGNAWPFQTESDP
jgi:hypothetical protein